MKKVLLLLSFLVAFFVSNAQYPVVQFLGRDSVLVDSRGGLKARLINYAFTDTTEANLQRISQYPGAMIYTTSGGDKLWLRNSTATGWSRVGSGSGGGNGIASLGTSDYGLIIQNDSTYKADTSRLSTRLWRQKGIDSVQANVNLKLNITDTSNKWVTLVYRKTATDSVFLVKGGSHIFAYKDSIGTGGGGGGITTVGSINGVSKSSNGAVISGSSIYFQTVDGTYPGLMTSAQKARLDSNSYLTIDKRYDSLAWRRNDSTFLIKSQRIQAYGTTITPTTTDSSILYNITKAPPTKQSVTSTSDTLHLVNDSTTFVNSTKIYGYSGEVRGWKDALEMTLTAPRNGDAIVYSSGTLINAGKVDTIYRTAGKDSIIFNISGTRYAIKDSTGGGGTPGGSTTQVQYNSSGFFAGSANMTFDGTMLTLPGSSTQSAIKAGTMEMQSLGVNNAWFGENVYYNAGWKARATGYTPMFYFPNGAMEFQTVSSTVSAGSTTTPITRLKIQANGRIAVGPNVGSLTATAHLHLSNGSNTASSAPLKFYLTGAAVMSTPEAGAVEAVVDTLYYTGNDAVRTQLARTLYASATLDFASTAAQNSADLTITVTGATSGDIVDLGVPNGSVNANTCFTAWVSASNTVTVRFNNYSSGAVDPASGTFKVRVFK